MGKKSKVSKSMVKAMSSDVAPILELKFGLDPLFTVSAHPSQNLFVTGSATGQAKLIKYDAELLEAKVSGYKNDKKKIWKSMNVKEKSLEHSNTNSGHDQAEDDGLVTLGWKTKRHKGSVRYVKFDTTGENIYSAGLDKCIKKANSETGQVVAKIETNLKSNITNLLTVPSKNFLMVGTEGGSVYCYDTRDLKEIYKIPKIHEDAINSINHYAPKSDYQFITTGSTTLAHFDVRKDKVMNQSEDQEDELLCSTWLDPVNPSTMLCGMGEGTVTLWKPEMNKFRDQISRVRLGKDSIESICSALDSDANYVWGGSSEGVISKIDVRSGKVSETRFHSSTDEVSNLDLDYDYRLISAGMDKMKIWSKDDDSDDEDDDDNSGFDKNSSDESDYVDSDDEKDSLANISDNENDDDKEEEWTGIVDSDNEKDASESGNHNEDNWEDMSSSEHEFSSEMSGDENEEVDSRLSEEDNSEVAEESRDEDSDTELHEDLKLKSRETMKRRFASMVNQTIADQSDVQSKKQKQDVESEIEECLNEISDSDDDNEDFGAGETEPDTKKSKNFQLKDIRDKLLSQLDDSDEEDGEDEVEAKADEDTSKLRKLTRKEKMKLKKKDKKPNAKQLKNLQTHEHGIRKFDDL